MDWTQILIQGLIMLGAGGVGAAIVNGLFGKRMTDATADSTESAARALAYKELAESTKIMVESMQDRLTRLHDRINSVEATLEARNMTIEELTKENKWLQSEIERLNEERERQISVNRSQGQLIANLRSENGNLAERIRCLEERLGDAC